MTDAVHIYSYYGNHESWSYLKAEDISFSPAVLLAKALQSSSLTRKTYLSLVEVEEENIGPASKGDIFIFPDRMKYSGFDSQDVDFETFVKSVLVDGETCAGGKELPYGNSYIFICSEELETQKCSVRGQALTHTFKEEIKLQNLGDSVFCFSSTHPTHCDDFCSELVLYNGLDLKEYWYIGLSPADARPILSSQFGDGSLPRMAIPFFDLFWDEFNKIVEYTDQARNLVETYHEFFIDQRNSPWKLNRKILKGHVMDADQSVDRCCLYASESNVLFNWTPIVARNLKLFESSVYKTIRKLRKQIEIEVSSGLTSATKPKVEGIAAGIRTLQYLADSLKMPIKSVHGTPQPAAGILRQSVCGYPILLPRHIRKVGNTTWIVDEDEEESYGMPEVRELVAKMGM